MCIVLYILDRFLSIFKMSDQLQYTEGTWVWAKIMKNIWWPGKIVLKDKVPHTIDKYINDKFNRCGEPIAIVYFEKDYTQ